MQMELFSLVSVLNIFIRYHQIIFKDVFLSSLFLYFRLCLCLSLLPYSVDSFIHSSIPSSVLSFLVASLHLRLSSFFQASNPSTFTYTFIFRPCWIYWFWSVLYPLHFMDFAHFLYIWYYWLLSSSTSFPFHIHFALPPTNDYNIFIMFLLHAIHRLID